ncbi:hypothetical protein A3C91_01000 [Candidatus Azambacteria bacterium RIFCSPHIGHO2_02_FULL_52_12]|uniref:Phosphatidic acid phosphatase type 2/haloperoxidase domain-containing protein n=1 Tax=Candidatus Azambacteria bacterium RIFCSPLOWO2_01_FULL_46_25 TaxID=1797298 RepID=A0A1F5BU23_9BACT|nr:MAG: hypothetical protein A3C91_01000 [Candidatus Azambacteria bacterium RIFCSPHIGHO2_02_FULL_52_12]OGD34098.1 MAG: hypothetical protein A2988_01280 [Candidatus Azambacteria bacterium RIFCSPLOWO2_01_FULL_46_25]OGD36697.1 MAG: hypothetical protein A2850_00235 [Candidatus Azambacteria bacterium RIFCSPHIGHO2_01_FULL_51_74]
MIRSFVKKCLDFFDFQFAIGVTVYLFFTVLAVYVTDTFRFNNDFAALDADMLAYAISLRAASLTALMKVITFLGSAPVIIGLTAAVLLWFAYHKRVAHFMVSATAIVGAAAMIYLMKHTFLRARPPFLLHLVSEDSYSFPSGHAFISLVFYGLLMYFVIRHEYTLRAKVLTCLASGLFIFLVGFSRLYLGVHWPSDVLGSWVMGGVWLAVVIWIAHGKFVPHPLK